MIDPPPPSAPNDNPMRAPAAAAVTATANVISVLGPRRLLAVLLAVVLAVALVVLEAVGVGADQVQADLLGVLEGVVDRDWCATGGVEERGGDGGAVAAGAVHPHLAGRGLGHATGQLVDRDVDRALDGGALVLIGPADVEDDDVAVVADLYEVGEGGGGEAGQFAGRPGLRVAGGLCGRAIDADADQLALGAGDVVGGLAEQSDRGAPVDEPAQVGRECAVDAEVERARGVTGGERGAVAQVDHPLAGFDAAAQLDSISLLHWREVWCRGAGGVRGGHVDVVGRPRAQTVEELADVGLPVSY